MKKILLMLLILSLTLALLAACGGSAAPEDHGGATGDGNTDGTENGGEDVATPPAPLKEAKLFYELTADGEGYIVVHNSELNAVTATIPATYNGKPVVAIGNSVFQKCTSLMTVSLPDSIVSIGDSAFGGCESLISFALPASLKSVGTLAFYGCYNLANFTVPEGLTVIGSDAFAGTAYYNKTANWENGILYLGKYLVSARPNVTECAVKEGTVSIAGSAFNSCASLASVSIPASVTHIGVGAFFSCTSLTEIRYAGTSEAWENTVNKEMYWDMETGEYTVICSDTN